ncbi:MAG: hypothetical protein ACI9FN_001785 [Saprospiraceae bacterium]|jgi:uncharacterized protein with PQ loop repeat
MDFLDFIPKSIFETMGVVAGLGVSFIVLSQIIKEYRSQQASTLTFGFLFGWLFIYTFWCFYGIRMGTIAIWMSNALAIILQIILCIVVLRKRSRRDLSA